MWLGRFYASPNVKSPRKEGRYHYQETHTEMSISQFVMKSNYQAHLWIIIACVVMEAKRWGTLRGFWKICNERRGVNLYKSLSNPYLGLSLLNNIADYQDVRGQHEVTKVSHTREVHPGMLIGWDIQCTLIAKGFQGLHIKGCNRIIGYSPCWLMALEFSTSHPLSSVLGSLVFTQGPVWKRMLLVDQGNSQKLRLTLTF